MSDARIGQVVNGRYRIEKRIAAGGMGVIYKAVRVGLSRAVAVKFLHHSSALVPQHRQRFEREADAMSRLTHPNLASIIDYGSDEGVPYLIMEYHHGETLTKALKRGAMEPQRAVHVARQMLAGLGSAHANSVVHRDLKPDNVLLVGGPGEDLVKILDFGVAKLIEGDGGPSELSVMASTVLGTPEYMAPEQARAQPVDARCDLYAVGIMLYEMVTGKRPFEGQANLAVLRMQVEDAPVPPRQLAPRISPELEAVILRALEKDREQRFESAVDMAAALAEVPEAGARVAVAKPKRRARTWLMVVLGVVLALGVGFWAAIATGTLELPWEASTSTVE